MTELGLWLYEYCEFFMQFGYISLIFYETFSVDIHECSSAPCLNAGDCIDNVNGYTCECIDGYTGNHCETGEFSLYL